MRYEKKTKQKTVSKKKNSHKKTVAHIHLQSWTLVTPNEWRRAMITEVWMLIRLLE